MLARVAAGAAALRAGGVGEMVALVAEEAVPLVVSMLVEPRIVSFQVVLRLLEAFKWPKSGSDPLVRTAFRAAGPGALAAGALPGGAEDLRRQPGAGAPATARPTAVPGAGACRAVLRGPSSARRRSGAPFAGACGPLLCDLHLGVNRRKGVPAGALKTAPRPAEVCALRAPGGAWLRAWQGAGGGAGCGEKAAVGVALHLRPRRGRCVWRALRGRHVAGAQAAAGAQRAPGGTAQHAGEPCHHDAQPVGAEGTGRAAAPEAPAPHKQGQPWIWLDSALKAIEIH